MRSQYSSKVFVIFAGRENSDKDLTQCSNDSLYTHAKGVGVVAV